MAYSAYDKMFGAVDLTAIDPAGPGYVNLVAGTGSGRMNFYMEELRGYDPNLGGGTFVYAKFAGTIAAGTWVKFAQTISGGQVIMTATAWAGTASTGEQLGVAVASGAASQWGWFQIQGNAVSTVQGTPAAGNPVYWQASGIVSPTAVNGKQVIGASFATAVSQTIGQGSTAVTLSSTQAIVSLNRPSVQTQIV